MTINRVFCPVDFSQTSHKALRYAGAIATWYEAILEVMHVIPDPAVSNQAPASAVPGEGAEQLRAAALTELKRFVDADLCSRLVGLAVHSGIPAAEILEHARMTRPDLLVIGTRGNGGLSHPLMGSNAERVVVQATCPVLTIPPHAREVTSPSFAQFKRIVAACDFSAASNHALTYATSLAQENAASLTLVHVIELFSKEEALAAADQRTIEYIEGRRRDAFDALQQLSAGQPTEACETIHRVELGSAAQVVLNVAAEIDADLIVMGAQSHGPVGVMVYGSATQTVLRRAACPVLTARTWAAMAD